MALSDIYQAIFSPFQAVSNVGSDIGRTIFNAGGSITRQPYIVPGTQPEVGAPTEVVGRQAMVPSASNPYMAHVINQQRQMSTGDMGVVHPSEVELQSRYGTRYGGMSNLIAVRPGGGFTLGTADESISHYLRTAEAIANPERTTANIALANRDLAVNRIYNQIQSLGSSDVSARAQYALAETQHNAAMDALGKVTIFRHAEDLPGIQSWLQGKGASPVEAALAKISSPPVIRGLSVEAAQSGLGEFPASFPTGFGAGHDTGFKFPSFELPSFGAQALETGPVTPDAAKIATTINEQIIRQGNVTETITTTTTTTTAQNRSLFGIIPLDVLADPFGSFMKANDAASHAILTVLGHGDYETGLAALNKVEKDWTEGAGNVLFTVMPKSPTDEMLWQAELISGQHMDIPGRKIAEFVVDVPFGMGSQWLRSPLTAGAWAAAGVVTAGAAEALSPVVLPAFKGFEESHPIWAGLASKTFMWGLSALYGLDVIGRISGAERPGVTTGQIITGEMLPMVGGAFVGTAMIRAARTIELPSFSDMGSVIRSGGRDILWNVQDAATAAFDRIRYPNVRVFEGGPTLGGAKVSGFGDFEGPVVDLVDIGGGKFGVSGGRGGASAVGTRLPFEQIPDFFARANVPDPTANLPALFESPALAARAGTALVPMGVPDFSRIGEINLPALYQESLPARVRAPFVAAAYYGGGPEAWPGPAGQYLRPDLDMPATLWGRTTSAIGAHPVSSIPDMMIDLSSFERIPNPKTALATGRGYSETFDQVASTLQALSAQRGRPATSGGFPAEETLQIFERLQLPALPAPGDVSVMAARPPAAEGYVSPPIEGLKLETLTRLWGPQQESESWLTLLTGKGHVTGPSTGAKLPASLDLTDVFPEMKTTLPVVYDPAVGARVRADQMSALMYRMTTFSPQATGAVENAARWRAMQGINDLMASLSSSSLKVRRLGGEGGGVATTRGVPGGGGGGRTVAQQILDLSKVGEGTLEILSGKESESVIAAIAKAGKMPDIPGVSRDAGVVVSRGGGTGQILIQHPEIQTPDLTAITRALPGGGGAVSKAATVDYASISKSTAAVSDAVNALIAHYTPATPRLTEVIFSSSRLPDTEKALNAISATFDNLAKIAKRGGLVFEVPGEYVGKYVWKTPLVGRGDLVPVAATGRSGQYFTTPDVLKDIGFVRTDAGAAVSFPDFERIVRDISGVAFGEGVLSRGRSAQGTIAGVDFEVPYAVDTTTVMRNLARVFEDQSSRVGEIVIPRIDTYLVPDVTTRITTDIFTTTDIVRVPDVPPPPVPPPPDIFKFPDIPMPKMPSFPILPGGGGEGRARRLSPFQAVFIYHPVPTLESVAQIKLPKIVMPSFDLPDFDF